MVDILPEGFDYYPDDPNAAGVGLYATWVKTGGAGAEFKAGRFGGKSIVTNQSRPGASYLTRLIPSCTEFGVGFAFQTVGGIGGNGVAGGYFASLNDSLGNKQIRWLVNDIGQVIITAGGATAILSTKRVLQNTWHYIELRGSLSLGAGDLELFIDGESQGTYEGVTQTGAVGDISRFAVGDEGATGAPNPWIDDLYVVTGANMTLGESRIQLLEMIGDSNVAFTPNPGPNNFANVDDTSSDGDASYNSSNTPGDIDLFDLTQITVNPSTIHAVSLVTAARKEDSATRSIRNVFKTGEVIAHGVTQNLTTDYTWIRDVLTLDANGNPWTKAAVNSGLPGYELIL